MKCEGLRYIIYGYNIVRHAVFVYLWPCDVRNGVSGGNAGENGSRADGHLLRLGVSSNLRQSFKNTTPCHDGLVLQYVCIYAWTLFIHFLYSSGGAEPIPAIILWETGQIVRSDIINVMKFSSHTLDVKDHLRLDGADVVGCSAAVLASVSLSHTFDPKRGSFNLHVIRQRSSHFTPLHGRNRVALGMALKLHRGAHRDRLHRRAHVDHHLRQGCNSHQTPWLYCSVTQTLQSTCYTERFKA